MKKLILILCLLLIGMTVMVVWKNTKPKPLGWAGGDTNVFDRATNSSTTFLNASSTTLLARNVDRQYARICNTTTTVGGGIWLRYSTSSDTVARANIILNGGIYVKELECYEIDNSNLFLGTIFGYSNTVGSTTVTIIEK